MPVITIAPASTAHDFRCLSAKRLLKNVDNTAGVLKTVENGARLSCVRSNWG